MIASDTFSVTRDAQAIDEHILDTASRSGAQASAKYTRGVLQFKGRSLRWLDEEQLLSAVTRSLT